MLVVKLINGIRQMTSDYKTMQPDEARTWLAGRKQGDHTLLDVRQDWEYDEAHIPGAVHIPLPELDERLGELDSGKPALVYCLSGGRSSAASSMLKGKGFAEVFNLMGGMNGWEGAAAVGPKSAGMLYFSGEETVEEVIALACRMEVNLGRFYAASAAKSEGDVAEMLNKLAGFEEKHKTWLLTIYRQMAGHELDPEFLTASAATPDGPPLEGGLTADEFIELNFPDFDEPKGIIEAGMMFEAQAMDLYSRYAMKADSEETRDLLTRLSQEEKGHLKALGVLLDRMGPA